MINSIRFKTFAWNSIFSSFNAIQSAVLLLLATRLCGVEDGGIISIAYATGVLLQCVGTYHVRNFHATDTRSNYTFQDYRRLRLVSCTAMVLVSAVYCVWKGYSLYKGSVVFAACLFQLGFAIEDLYHGELQRRGRLDIAGCAGTLRLAISDAAFAAVLVTTKDLPAAMYAMAGCTLLYTALFRIWVTPLICRKLPEAGIGAETGKSGKQKQPLLLTSFPLFVTGFPNSYITTAAKYAIDACSTETVQAYFSILVMPLWTISLLSDFIYRPQLKEMAELWNGGEKERFVQMVRRQAIWIALIAAGIFAFGVVIGLNLLGLLYGLDLSGYRSEFALLLAGGGAIALSNYLGACITIMRRLRYFIIRCVILMPAAWAASHYLVSRYALWGASLSYLLVMGASCIGAVVAYIHCIKGTRKKHKLSLDGAEEREGCDKG